MASISPLLQTKIAQQQNTTQSPIETPKINLTQKPDRVEINSSTNKKKVAKYVGTGIAIAGALATTAFLLTKGKTCLLEFNAKKAQKYAEEIQEKAEKLKNEVIELFAAGGNKVANITDDVDGNKIMKEIDSSGTLIRMSTFNSDGTLSEIKLRTKKGADFYNFKDGKLFEYSKNFQKALKTNISIAKRLRFEDGKLFEYAKNFQYDFQEKISIAKRLLFKDGKLFEYAKNYQQDSENISMAKRLLFEDGKLAEYAKNYQEDFQEKISIAKRLLFKDGKLFEYAKNFQQDSENISTTKEIEFTPGKPLINLLEFLKSFKKDS